MEIEFLKLRKKKSNFQNILFHAYNVIKWVEPLSLSQHLDDIHHVTYST